MAAWSEEEKVFFNYDTLGCVPGEQCGHYTQVIVVHTFRVPKRRIFISSFEKEIIKFYYRMLSHTYTENNLQVIPI